MTDIKKKIIAIGVICAMALSMVACSDKEKGTTDDIQTVTLTSEEAEGLRKKDLEIVEWTESYDNVQDPVESNDSSSAGSNDSTGDSAGGSSSDSSISNDSSRGSVDQSSFDAEELMSNTEMVIVPGDNLVDDSRVDNDTPANSNDSQNGITDDSATIKGTKKIQQAFWMNLSGNYVFDGEFITATFKIKETTEKGTYPITVDWLDFSNIDGVTVPATGINGSIVVGGDVVANTFKNDGSFEVMADNVSGKAGDTVTVTFRLNKNSGICASVLRFGYDSDALEYVGGEEGDDLYNALLNQNLN